LAIAVTDLGSFVGSTCVGVVTRQLRVLPGRNRRKHGVGSMEENACCVMELNLLWMKLVYIQAGEKMPPRFCHVTTQRWSLDLLGGRL
jgi:hypothetical protein